MTRPAARVPPPRRVHDQWPANAFEDYIRKMSTVFGTPRCGPPLFHRPDGMPVGLRREWPRSVQQAGCRLRSVTDLRLSSLRLTPTRPDGPPFPSRRQLG
jgi:hypothetical protein